MLQQPFITKLGFLSSPTYFDGSSRDGDNNNNNTSVSLGLAYRFLVTLT
jgi:hypothetical protein